MDKNFDNNLDPEQFSLEAILAEYRAEEEIESAHRSAVEQQSRSIMIEALGDTISSSVEEPEPEPEAEPEPETQGFEDSEPHMEHYSAADFADIQPEPEERPRPVRKKSLGETLMAPVLGLLASAAAKYHDQGHISPTAEPIDEGPELAPKKAARLYSMQLRSLEFRTRAATGLCLLLTYITFAYTGFLPLFGALGSSSSTAALVCLIILASVMFTGSEVFTSGILSLLRLKPGAESLAALSCLLSMTDAVLVAAGKLDFGLPLCAASAWSICMGLWSSRFTCSAMVSTFSTLAEAKKTPTAIATEPGIVENAYCVVKTETELKNFVRRSECADLGEISQIVAAPFLLAAAFVLALLASFKFGAGAFVHLFSAMLAACASLGATVSFSMPFASSAKRLHIVGAALAGYEGCADIGTARRFVVLDKDIFPPHTISIDRIQINGKDKNEKVIGYTGSLIAASGSALAPAFTRLMQKNNCTISKVEDFECHEGGGIIAHINSEEVLIGSSSFMSLMGIRLPPGLTAKNAVFTVINGELAGIFTVTYTPTGSVQRALQILLRDYRFPIFAVRDFNINPMMIRQKFQVVTDDFEFPTFAERYRVSAVEHDESSPIAAAVTRHGLGTMVECADSARRLYAFTRLLVILSLVFSALGMVVVLLLCTGDVPSAALASRLLLFMLLSLLPNLVISYSLR
ncbi:MAG: hypothetical protein ACOX81_04045 [Candidatus Heteroscillospira sp.]|jgi:hypothetical protein